MANLLANSLLITYPAGTRHLFWIKCFLLCSKVKYFLSFSSLLGNSCLCKCQMPVYIYQLVINCVCLVVEQVMHRLFLALFPPAYSCLLGPKATLLTLWNWTKTVKLEAGQLRQRIETHDNQLCSCCSCFSSVILCWFSKILYWFK